MSSNDKRAIGIVALAGIAVLAALWFLAISPKRADRAEVRDNVTAQQTRLTAAQSTLASYEASHKQFPTMLAKLRQLDKAVPSNGAIANLLRQLQRRAHVKDSVLQLVALKSSGTPAPAAPGTTAPVAPTTPGSTVGPNGLAALPFTFEFTGKYFDLRDILATVRHSIRTTKNGDVKVSGRLLTIDGLTFNRDNADSQITKATINATAYIAPDGTATPTPPATATAPTTAGGS